MTARPGEDARRPATLVHTSDCHLAKDDGGPGQQAFEAVVNLAIARRAHALLIAGDLFDHSRVGPDIVSWVARQLNRFPGPVVLLVGNHDCLDEISVHHRHDLREMCDRLFMLRDPEGSSVDVPDSDISVWGRAMVEHAPAFRPLANAPQGRSDRWSVIAAHGLLDAEPDRSSPIMSTELEELTADYVALGHIHVHTIVRQTPPTRYSGSTLGHGSGSSGCLVVQFVPNEGAFVEWVALDEYMTSGQVRSLISQH